MFSSLCKVTGSGQRFIRYVVQLHLRHLSFASSFYLSQIGRSGSLLNTVRPVTDVHQSRPYRGCWCCCRCCPGTCRPPGPDERDRLHRWTLCWSAPPRASTSPGLRHSASGWTLPGRFWITRHTAVGLKSWLDSKGCSQVTFRLQVLMLHLIFFRGFGLGSDSVSTSHL